MPDALTLAVSFIETLEATVEGPPALRGYVARLNAWTRRNQLISGFQLAMFWSTILRS